MATATYSVSTGSSDLNTVWRTVQAGVLQAFKFDFEEWGWLQKLKNFDIDWSSRSITFEADLADDIGTAMITEGGKEARPSSQKPVTATVTWVQANKRFTVSKTTRYIEQQQGVRGQLVSQFKYQTKKAVQGIRRKIADQFYGFSSGTVAKVGSVSTDDIVLKDLFGISGLGSLTAGPGGGISNLAVSDIFRVGDYIAVLNPTGPALRVGGIVAITAITRSTITVTCGASGITSPTASDLIVFANNVENTTLAAGTERNLNLVGLLDMITSTSVHNISSSSQARWAAAINNSSGGRFDGVKLRKMKQAIMNNGGGTLTDVIWSNGVENDVFAQLQAGLRFSDAFALEMDGKPVSKGVTFRTSARVPDGYVFGFDNASVRKMVLLPEPGTLAWDDGDKLQDDNGYVFGMDYPCAMVTTNRGNLGLYSGITQQ